MSAFINFVLFTLTSISATGISVGLDAGKQYPEQYYIAVAVVIVALFGAVLNLRDIIQQLVDSFDDDDDDLRPA